MLLALREAAPAISAITALVAVFLGPFFAYRIAKKQLYGNLITSQRLKWVDDLRLDIVSFISLYNQVILAVAAVHESGDSEEAEARKRTHDLVIELSKVRFLIGMKLDVQIDIHRSLMDLVNATVDHLDDFWREKQKEPNIRDFAYEVGRIAIDVLDRERNKAEEALR